ncbi:MAG: hypothetical protein ABIO80_03650 [Sphingomicrobium sp.]
MRITTPILAAMAVLVAAPAAAQNDTVANTTVMVPDNSMDANAMTPADTAAMAGNQTAVLPVDDNVAMVDTTTAEVVPAPPPKKGFPWGVLGLLGLIGLIPRTGGTRRD